MRLAWLVLLAPITVADAQQATPQIPDGHYMCSNGVCIINERTLKLMDELSVRALECKGNL